MASEETFILQHSVCNHTFLLQSCIHDKLRQIGRINILTNNVNIKERRQGRNYFIEQAKL